MIEAIIVAVATVGTIAIILAIGLAYASRKFATKEDPKVEKVFQALPQNNCGACGYPSCLAFAKSVVENPNESMHCRLGGEKVAIELSKILGVKITARDNKLAVVTCRNGSGEKFRYVGIKSCRAASLLADGQKSCHYSCLGFGDCLSSCQFGALVMQDNFLTVIKEKCVGCGLCIKACPKQVISLRNRNEAVQIRCHSGDAKSVAKNCKFGCIACGICVKSCPKKAVSIKEIAAIDYSKCDSCGTCAKVCPRKVIEQLQGG